MKSGSICEMRAVSASGPPSVQPVVIEPNGPSAKETDASAFTCPRLAGSRKRFWNRGPIHVARSWVLTQVERKE